MADPEEVNVQQRTCERDGCSNQLGSNLRQRYCTKRCNDIARGVVFAEPLPERACDVCAGIFQPRQYEQRYCGTRCKKRVENAKRGGWDPTSRPMPVPFDCAQCGKHCVPGENVAAHASRFCGRPCVKAWHHIHTEGRPCKRTAAQRKLGKAAQGITGRATWFDRACPECGQHSLARHIPRDDNGYCSTTCRLKQKRRRRRARMRGADSKTLSFRAIAERDQWTCALCGTAVDPRLTVPALLAPTLDHIMPLAWGGAHTEENTQLAHFICNSRKGAGHLSAGKTHGGGREPFSPGDR